MKQHHAKQCAYPGSNADFEIAAVGKDRRLAKQFIKLPHAIYQPGSPWVAPLFQDALDMLDSAKNHFFTHGAAEFFLCFRQQEGGRKQAVGRISAQIDHEHLRIHDDGAGFYGCFESIDNIEVARLLFDGAARWLACRGMTIMRGPYTLNINGDAGLLVDGFEHVPMMGTAYNQPYYRRLVESCGFVKVKELYSWKYARDYAVPQAVERILARALPGSGITLRTVRMDAFEAEIRRGLQIFNDAWAENWSFIPLSDAEKQKIITDMKMIADKRLILVVEHRGKIAGMAITVPNINEVLHPLRGTLLPFGWMKLLWHMKISRPKTCRLMILGIQPEMQRQRIGGIISLLLSVETFKRGKAAGYETAELSWTLDDNHGINHVIGMMGATVFKTHYVYERPIG